MDDLTLTFVPTPDPEPQLKDGDLLRMVDADGNVLGQGIVVDHRPSGDSSFSFRVIPDPELDPEAGIES